MPDSRWVTAAHPGEVGFSLVELPSSYLPGPAGGFFKESFSSLLLSSAAQVGLLGFHFNSVYSYIFVSIKHYKVPWVHHYWSAAPKVKTFQR